MEPEKCTKILKKLSKKLRAKFPGKHKKKKLKSLKMKVTLSSKTYLKILIFAQA